MTARPLDPPDDHDDDDFFEVEPPLASVVRAWRIGSVKLSLRRLAKVSGVSLAQLSRIESGQVTRPSIEALWALAPALNCHPTVLLVLAGHLRGDRAREALREILEHATPAVVESAPDDGAETIREIHRMLDDADSDQAMNDAAMNICTLWVRDVDLPASLAAIAPAAAPDAHLLTEIVAAWPQLTPDRRWRLVELVHDLRVASQVSSTETTT